MALICPVDLDTQRLRADVHAMYTRVASDPGGTFHFHRGPAYAAERLGYDPAELAALPDSVTASFAGIGNPHLVRRVEEGATVLDLGSGAGTDLLIAARRVGASGRAIGIDMTDAMIARARDGAAEAGLRNVALHRSDATALPVEDQEVDVVISNGVVNLVPDKHAVLDELFRIVRPGGRLQIADIVLGVELSEDARADIDLWTG
ncbi:MAG: methyltransferase domain-containing protein [Acidobacteriota bacterium]